MPTCRPLQRVHLGEVVQGAVRLEDALGHAQDVVVAFVLGRTELIGGEGVFPVVPAVTAALQLDEKLATSDGDNEINC